MHFGFRDLELQKRFESDGVVQLDLLSEDEVSVLNEAYQRFSASPGRGFYSTILSQDVAERRSVNKVISSVLQSAIEKWLDGFRQLVSTFAVKTARQSTTSVPIHQDWSFVDETRFYSIGLWCPLSDVSAHNGCLQVVKGSHSHATLPRGACTPFLYPELIPVLRERYLRCVPLSAGQALLFDHRLFHCSTTNCSESNRVAATSVLIPRDCRPRYYHAPDPQNPMQLDVFEVDMDFYVSHKPGARPLQQQYVGAVRLTKADCSN